MPEHGSSLSKTVTWWIQAKDIVSWLKFYYEVSTGFPDTKVECG